LDIKDLASAAAAGDVESGGPLLGPQSRDSRDFSGILLGALETVFLYLGKFSKNHSLGLFVGSQD
jgi:hypothetical protein